MSTGHSQLKFKSLIFLVKIVFGTSVIDPFLNCNLVEQQIDYEFYILLHQTYLDFRISQY